MPSIHFVSLGCPKNRVDTEVMLGLVTGAGFTVVAEPERAEVIVVNTCGFIGDARRESVDTILELARHKQEGHCRTLVVTGCLVQRHADELAQSLPEADFFLGAADFPRIAELLRGGGPRATVSATPSFLYDHTTPRQRSLPPHTSYVKIAEGCSRRCSFCIIPSLRGPQRSRDPGSVVAEVEALAAGGTVEINLVAQDLTAYGEDRADGSSLAALLRLLGKVSAVRWLRLLYTYPSGITEQLLDAIAEVPSVARYLDLPLQHIDDQVLRHMRRGHGERFLRRLLGRIRTRLPELTLRTTLLVGHPGETPAAFDRLARFVEEAEFDHLGVFRYSREEGTAAAGIPGRVAASEAQRRARHLMALQRRISRRKLRQRVGEEIEVLVDGTAEESPLLLCGRHAGQAPEIDGCVYLTDGTARPGSLVRARVVRTSDYDLVASIF